MKKISTIFLQAVIILIGIGVLVFMLWEPHLESRNVNATLFQIYFNDLFLAYAYIASIPFFTALYQAFKLFGYIGRNELYSQRLVKALRTIKYCAAIVVAFIVAAEAYLFIVRPEEGIAGGVFMGILTIAVSGTISAVAARFEKYL